MDASADLRCIRLARVAAGAWVQAFPPPESVNVLAFYRREPSILASEFRRKVLTYKRLTV